MEEKYLKGSKEVWRIGRMQVVYKRTSTIASIKQVSYKMNRINERKHTIFENSKNANSNNKSKHYYKCKISEQWYESRLLKSNRWSLENVWMQTESKKEAIFLALSKWIMKWRKITERNTVSLKRGKNAISKKENK